MNRIAKRTVVILGASPEPRRYANLAQHRLVEAGHRVIPINPIHDSIDGLATVKQLSDIDETVDTLTVYVNPKRSITLADDIIRLKPRRVIFNPGTESPELAAKLKLAGIETEDACTLVLLKTGQF